MKVREENADLINFYLKQGHKLTKTQRHSFGGGGGGEGGEQNHGSLSFQCFPTRMGRKFSMFTSLFFSPISQCYRLIRFIFSLNSLALQVLRPLREGPWEHGVLPRPREEKVELPLQEGALHIHTALKSSCFHEELEEPGEEQENVTSVHHSTGGIK